MKKIIISVLLLICLWTLPAFAAKKAVSEEMKKHGEQCEYNIKLLANALELYANDHFVDYPTNEQFQSKKFNKYIFKALGKEVKNTDRFYRCPPTGWLKYERVKNERAFRLYCPNPQKYGLKTLSFTSHEGFIKDDGSAKSGGLDVKAEKFAEQKMTDAEKEEVNAVIKELFEAYKNRKLDEVMDLEEEAIVRTGKAAEEKGKYKMIEVYYAFRGTANDVFRAEGFGMEPMDLSRVIYKKKGNKYIASSPTPIIATKLVTVGTMKVRLRIASLTFEKIKGKMKIVQMQMY